MDVDVTDEVMALSPRHHLSHHSHDQAALAERQVLANEQFEQRFANVFKYFEFTAEDHDAPRSESPLVEIAIDLTDYDHLPLAAKAFQFLLASFSQERKMHHLLKSTSIVVDEGTKGVIEEVHLLCDEFRLKNRYGMKLTDAAEILRICRKLMNLAAHEGTLHILSCLRSLHFLLQEERKKVLS
jgi:hypothetical protein